MVKIFFEEFIYDHGFRYKQPIDENMVYENVNKEGQRMEDHISISKELLDKYKIFLLCISDGHGSCKLTNTYYYGGYECAKYSNLSITKYFVDYQRENNNLNDLSAYDIYKLITQAFLYAHHNIQNLVYENLISNPELLEKKLKVSNNVRVKPKKCVIEGKKNLFKEKIYCPCVFNENGMKLMDSGCTTTIILIINEKVYTANVGDSLAYVYDVEKSKITQLTEKHTCESLNEIERMTSDHLSKIYKDNYFQFLVKIMTKDEMDSSCHENKSKLKKISNLQIKSTDEKNKNILKNDTDSIRYNYTKISAIMPSRSVGHNVSYYCGIKCEPNINHFKIQNDVKIVVATDGFWDEVQEGDLKDIFIKNKNLDDAELIKKLQYCYIENIKKSLKKNYKYKNKIDNIIAFYISLKK